MKPHPSSRTVVGTVGPRAVRIAGTAASCRAWATATSAGR